MFEKKEDFEDSNTAETVVGTSVKLKGTLKSEGNISINGIVSGEVRTKADVLIGGSADIRANVTSRNAVISGIVQGNIKVEGELKITETGKVYGDIESKVLNIAPGAVFSGRSAMQQEKKEENHMLQEEDVQMISEDEEIPIELEA